MKLFRKALLTFILAAVPVFINAQDNNKKLQKVTFRTSIDCQNCVNNIMNNLPREKGVKDVKCDLKTKEVTVKYQLDKTNTATLQKEIEKLGYTAKPAEKADTVTNKEK
ncbi:MAG: heavy metal-associated domain-containing protein [Bacteroidales bacterium]